MARVAILGTGLLGAGFASNLLAKGDDVVVWNRTREKTRPLAERGATVADDPASAVAQADRVHLVLAADDAVDAVLKAALPSLPQGVYVIDHSTNAPARVAERAARLRDQGVRYVHAPVFMAPKNAHNGTGLMLLATSQSEADQLTPILSTMTGKVWHVGDRADLAAVHKLCGNGMLVAMAGVLGDLFAIGQEQGLEPDQVLGLFEVFQAGGSLPFVGKRVAHADKMDASFELTMARKDVRLMIEAAGGPDKLVLLPAAAKRMDDALQAGQGDRDFAIFAWPGRPTKG